MRKKKNDDSGPDLFSWKPPEPMPKPVSKFVSVSTEDDICRNYHGGNPESEAANEETLKSRDRKRIHDVLLSAGLQGRTCDELEIVTGLSHQTCSARCSELLRDGIIVRKPDPVLKYMRRPTRTGCQAAVLILKSFETYDRN